MLEPSKIIFGTSVLLGLGVLVEQGVLCGLELYLGAINPVSPGLSRHPTSCRKFS